MEQVLRQHNIRKVWEGGLKRSVKGAAKRANEEGVWLMVEIRPNVPPPEGVENIGGGRMSH